jgi:hypothetical protein
VPIGRQLAAPCCLPEIDNGPEIHCSSRDGIASWRDVGMGAATRFDDDELEAIDATWIRSDARRANEARR